MFAFDFSNAFDSVNHYIKLSKLKQLPINPYIYYCVRGFLSDSQQQPSKLTFFLRGHLATEYFFFFLVASENFYSPKINMQIT